MLPMHGSPNAIMHKCKNALSPFTPEKTQDLHHLQKDGSKYFQSLPF